MSQAPLPFISLIRENLSILMTFAYSQPELSQLWIQRYGGRLDRLGAVLFRESEQRAIRACVELAALLRLLDDRENLNEYLKTSNFAALGVLKMDDGSEEPLYIRDVTNKIMHADSYQFQVLVTRFDHKLICKARPDERWVTAEIDLVALAVVCGHIIG